MVVGGRWSGWGRAWAHTVAYARSYFMVSLLSALFGPVVILLLLSLFVIVPGAFCANVLFVRLFPKKSWLREPRRSWVAAAAGVPLVVVGSLAWVSISGRPPEVLRQFGMAGDLIYILGIPVFLSNLCVLVGYLLPRAIPPSGPPSSIPPPGSPAVA